MSGTNITVKGTTIGVVTDAQGKFSFSVDEEATLIFSFIGYQTKQISIRQQRYIEIILEENIELLGNVVVTALGIKREKASLVYSVDQLKGEELNRVKNPNMINTLTGKIAGVQINKVFSGIESSSRILMRGIRSVARNNQPLYVIDGVPILNSINEQAYTAIGGTADAGNRDGGDGISNLNPEDIIAFPEEWISQNTKNILKFGIHHGIFMSKIGIPIHKILNKILIG